MKRTALFIIPVALLIMIFAGTVYAESVYKQRPEDPGAVYFTRIILIFMVIVLEMILMPFSKLLVAREVALFLFLKVVIVYLRLLLSVVALE